MKFKLLFLYLGFLFILFFFNCSSAEVVEDDPDDVLEEELRADPEPFKDLKDKEIKDNSKIQSKNNNKR